jgi:hypothetical protein
LVGLEFGEERVETAQKLDGVGGIEVEDCGQ